MKIQDKSREFVSGSLGLKGLKTNGLILTVMGCQ